MTDDRPPRLAQTRREPVTAANPRDGYDERFAMRAEEAARELARWENEGGRI